MLAMDFVRPTVDNGDLGGHTKSGQFLASFWRQLGGSFHADVATRGFIGTLRGRQAGAMRGSLESGQAL